MIDLSKIDTIVFLMMENRSFDHMVGHLSLDGGLGVDGLKPPLQRDLYRNEHDGRAHFPFEMRDAPIDGDVPHHRPETMDQMAWSAAEDRFLMNGFARSYYAYAAAHGIDADPDRCIAMGYLPRQDVPITTFFAEKYAVCDRWFGSLPTSTPPNKIFSLSGRTRVEDITPTLQPSDRLLIDWCSERNVRWRVYHDGLTFFAVFGRLDVIFDSDKFRGFGQLMSDVASEPDATFPQVIIIEPNYESGPHYGDQPNDSHPPLPVSFGEDFQRRCYEALTVNPERWKKTVFVITYDEHGGFFDHVPPHEVVYAPPDGEFEPFTCTGPRVPGLVISPLVAAGTVFSRPLDHTSVLQLVSQRFAPNEPIYSAEVAARRAGGIGSVAEVLNRNTPRNDIPAAPDVLITGAAALGHHDDGTPIARLFALAGRKLIEQRPDETAALFPHLWNWHLASGGELPPRPPAPAFEIAGLSELIREHAGKKLQELPKEVMSASARGSFAFSRGKAPKVKLTIKPQASVEILAFNSEDDRDPDGVIAKRAGGGGARFPAQIVLDTSRAWMKYAFEADLAAGVDATLEGLGFGFDADKKLRVCEYKVHDRDAIAVSTVLTDLARPRFALREADIESLRVGDCLTMQFVGTLKADVTLRWADVFSTQFGDLGTLLNSSDVIPLKFSSGLTLAASVSLMDDFILAFSRAAPGTLRVAVRKARQRRAGVSFESSMKVEFARPKDVEEALQALLEGLIGEPLAKVERLLASNLAEKLSGREAEILAKVLAAVGVDPAIPDAITRQRQLIREAKRRFAELKQSLDEKVREIARQKITVGFKYEYERVATHASVLQATIDDGELATYHADLLRGRLEGLLAALREAEEAGDAAAGVALESYLERDTLKTTKSWGFTLGIGPWKVYGRDRETLSGTVDENLAGRKKVAYHGLRGYRGNWIGEEFEWTFDFRADMPRYSAGPAPKLAEFELGLTLIWERREKLTDKALAVLLDAASLWRVAAPGSFPLLRERLAGSVDKECEIALQLRVDDGLFRRILPAMGTATLADFAAPLGAAMPWMEDYPGRATVTLRRQLYAPWWAYYFTHPTVNQGNLASAAANHFRWDTDYPDLYSLELNYSVREPFTLAGLVRLNGNTIVDIEKFNEGMATLADGVAADRHDNGLIEAVFAKIKNLGKQSHHVRALGFYLNERIAAAGGVAGVERTLTVDDGDDVHVFGK